MHRALMLDICALMHNVAGMSTQTEIAELEERAKTSGVNIADVLRRAKIDRSMWTRWKNGKTVPRLDNWRAVEAALNDLCRGVAA